MPTHATSAQDRYYFPTLGERLRLMGWRNVLWLPPILIVVWIGSAAMYQLSALFSVLVWWKPIVIAFGLPLAAAIRASAAALSKRDDPFCIHCGYSLTAMPSGPTTCPECGATVNTTESFDYRRDPHWFIKRRTLVHRAAHVPFEAGSIRVENPDGL